MAEHVTTASISNMDSVTFLTSLGIPVPNTPDGRWRTPGWCVLAPGRPHARISAPRSWRHRPGTAIFVGDPAIPRSAVARRNAQTDGFCSD